MIKYKYCAKMPTGCIIIYTITIKLSFVQTALFSEFISSNINLIPDHLNVPGLILTHQSISQ